MLVGRDKVVLLAEDIQIGYTHCSVPGTVSSLCKTY